MKINQDFDADFNLDDFSDVEIDMELEFETRYIKPPKTKPNKFLKYQNAKKLAQEINELKTHKYNIIVNGSFIFGDFLEAFIVGYNLKVKELTLSTLSLSIDNVDSLSNLFKGKFVEKINLITSGYFYSHEKYNLIPYLLNELDLDNKFEYAAADSHCKIYMMELLTGEKIVIQGSVNLRSSDNIEQFTIEMDTDLYDFYYEYQSSIIEKYKTIDKTVRGKKQINQILNIK